MAETIEQYLAASERVLYRTPRNWLPPKLLRKCIFYGILFGVGIATDSVNIEPDRVPSLSALLVVLFLLAARYAVRVRSMEIAITDRRLLRLAARDEPFLYRSIALDQVAAVTFTADTVKVTKPGGEVVTLPQPEYAAEICSALKAAAGLEVPRAPERKEVVATYVAMSGGTAGALSVLGVVNRLVSSAGLTPVGFPLCVPLIFLFLLTPILGWLAGEVTAAALARRFLDPKTFTNWHRDYVTLKGEPPESAAAAWLLNLRRRLFDFAVGPLPPVQPKEGGHG